MSILAIALIVGAPSAAVALILAALYTATRYRGRHRGHVRADRVEHSPRHARTQRPVRHAEPTVDLTGLYAPRHEAAAPGLHVALAAQPDGDLTYVHALTAAEPAVDDLDEPTEERRALVGASA